MSVKVLWAQMRDLNWCYTDFPDIITQQKNNMSTKYKTFKTPTKSCVPLKNYEKRRSSGANSSRRSNAWHYNLVLPLCCRMQTINPWNVPSIASGLRCSTNKMKNTHLKSSDLSSIPACILWNGCIQWTISVLLH